MLLFRSPRVALGKKDYRSRSNRLIISYLVSKQARLNVIKSVLVSSGIAWRAKYATARKNPRPQKTGVSRERRETLPLSVTFPVIFHARMRISNRSIIPDEMRNYSKYSTLLNLQMLNVLKMVKEMK